VHIDPYAENFYVKQIFTLNQDKISHRAAIEKSEQYSPPLKTRRAAEAPDHHGAEGKRDFPARPACTGNIDPGRRRT